jgi:hypothetical protein
MSPSFAQRVAVPENVMFRELEGEAVILDLDSESYFGLDEVGTRMWLALTGAASVQEAFDELAGEYEVAPDTLRKDLDELLAALLDRGLLEVADG